MTSSNNAIIYKAHPTEYPEEGKHLAFEKRAYTLEDKPLELDEFITENLYVSIDPYQRGRMRPEEKKSYFPPFQLGQPMSNSGVARVIKSNNARFPEGQLVYGMLDWAEYSRISAPVS
jgi:NADPH-dependent curcumin reductase CurA